MGAKVYKQLLVYATENAAMQKAAEFEAEGASDVEVSEYEGITLRTYSPLTPQLTTVFEDGRTVWLVSASTEN